VVGGGQLVGEEGREGGRRGVPDVISEEARDEDVASRIENENCRNHDEGIRFVVWFAGVVRGVKLHALARARPSE
jgi:hypothetical protein